MKYIIASTNPHLYKALFDKPQESEDMKDIEWLAPSTPEEVEAYMRQLEELYA